MREERKILLHTHIINFFKKTIEAIALLLIQTFIA